MLCAQQKILVKKLEFAKSFKNKKEKYLEDQYTNIVCNSNNNNNNRKK